MLKSREIHKFTQANGAFDRLLLLLGKGNWTELKLYLVCELLYQVPSDRLPSAVYVHRQRCSIYLPPKSQITLL